MPKLSESVAIGQVLLGKYRVESILGLGGMGVVAQCMHIALNERVAIKMMRDDVTADPGAIERFIREAQAAAKLKSEFAARVSDVGTFEDGTHYMVMEYLEGQDLGRLLEQRTRLQTPWAAELILQAAEALSEAHSLNIVHRDVKPTNLFVTWRPDGTALIKVLDFGVSKVYGGSDLRLTNTQSLLGTPAYMSPEQMRSARLVDPRTDIWALGVVLYELVEGRRPFDAESFTELCVKVSIDPPLPMEHAPAELRPVVARCLEKNPDQRYATMSELARDLQPFVKNQREAGIIVDRIERMLRRAAPRAPSPPVDAVVHATAATMNTAPPQRKWLEITPTTEPDVNVAEFVAAAENRRVAENELDRPTEPSPPPPAPRPPIVPPPVEHSPAASDEMNDSDTIFEAGAAHVPFSDRRSDYLAPKPLPLLSAPTPIAVERRRTMREANLDARRGKYALLVIGALAFVLVLVAAILTLARR